MLPTPDTSHVPYQRVYEPAEDSFLLLDTLSSSSETVFLSSRFVTGQDGPVTTTPFILEVGPGSGVVVAFLTAHARAIFGTRSLFTLAVDVNRFACVATEKTVSKAVADTVKEEAEAASRQAVSAAAAAAASGNGSFLAALQGDLTTPLRQGQVDVLVFNPPYVPTPELPSPPPPPPPSTSQSSSLSGSTNDQKTTFEQDSHLLELSYAGGKDGMETTDRLIDSLPAVLSEMGVAYILLCAQNKPEEVKERIRAWSSCSSSSGSSSSSAEGGGQGGGGKLWKAETVGTSGKQAGWEKLQIVRIWRD